MSQRASVDHQRIERFLRQLGQRFHGTGRIYLVGGTTMVYGRFREQTLDIGIFQRPLYALCCWKDGRMEGWEPNLPSFHPCRFPALKCQIILGEI